MKPKSGKPAPFSLRDSSAFCWGDSAFAATACGAAESVFSAVGVCWQDSRATRQSATRKDRTIVSSLNSGSQIVERHFTGAPDFLDRRRRVEAEQSREAALEA
jgi:hypothetical protein